MLVGICKHCISLNDKLYVCIYVCILVPGTVFPGWKKLPICAGSIMQLRCWTSNIKVGAGHYLETEGAYTGKTVQGCVARSSNKPIPLTLSSVDY